MSVPPAPPQPIAYASTMTLPFANRRTRLIVWGVLFLLAAALFACSLVATPLFLALAPRPALQAGPNVHMHDTYPQARQIAIAVAVYLLLAAAFAVVGVGSLLPRRWVRPLVLTLAVIWLIVGVVTLVSMAVSFGAMNDLMAAQLAAAGGGPTPVPIGAIVAFTLAVSVVIYLLIPLAIFLSYRPQSVRETLEHFDPRPRWTDAAPAEVLGIAVKLWLLAAMSGLMALYPAVPLGPVTLRGAGLYAVAAVSAVACGAIGWLIYRQRRLGWTLTMALAVLVGLLMAWTGVANDYDAFWASMQLPADQVDVMRRHAGSFRAATVVLGVLTVIGSVAYGLRVRHYFDR